jgi:hypothetical protein
VTTQRRRQLRRVATVFHGTRVMSTCLEQPLHREPKETDILRLERRTPTRLQPTAVVPHLELAKTATSGEEEVRQLIRTNHHACEPPRQPGSRDRESARDMKSVRPASLADCRANTHPGSERICLTGRARLAGHCRHLGEDGSGSASGPNRAERQACHYKES